MPRKTILLISIALIALVSCSWFVGSWFFSGRRNSQEYLTLYGNIDVREVQLGFRVYGKVEEMAFEEGDLVPKGTFMATLDKRPYLDQVNQAKAAIVDAEVTLLNAEEIYVRREKLKDTGAISEEDYTNALSSRNSALAKLQEAQASLATAQTNLFDTEIYAPTTGTILTRIREPGTVVNIGEPIYTLSVLSPVWARCYVSEPELGLVYPGMKAEISSDTPGGKVYKAQVGFISPVAEFTPKTVQTTSLRTDLVYRLRVYADNPDFELKQGMPVTVKLLLKQPLESSEETP